MKELLPNLMPFKGLAAWPIKIGLFSLGFFRNISDSGEVSEISWSLSKACSCCINSLFTGTFWKWLFIHNFFLWAQFKVWNRLSVVSWFLDRNSRLFAKLF